MKEHLLDIFGDGIKRIISKTEPDKLEEIRLRCRLPLAVRKKGGQYFVSPKGELLRSEKGAHIVTQKDLSECLQLISGYSIYAFEEEMKNGFITIKGGHRVGICGKTVVESREIKTIRTVSSLNIRVSHEIKGCADEIMKYIVKKGRIHHTLIVSPPRCGKTTLLRDIVRQLSNGIKEIGFSGVDVGVVDERSEIAGSYMGVAQNDVGVRTDVLDCCPKADGMHMVLRSMSPQVLAIDEIGRAEDIHAIEEILNAGVKLICTVHGEGITDIKRKPHLKELIDNCMFDLIVVLSGKKEAGEIEGIYDGSLEEYKGDDIK